eukprot:31407-Pelagococcus_subviridis.AAC.3
MDVRANVRRLHVQLTVHAVRARVHAMQVRFHERTFPQHRRLRVLDEVNERVQGLEMHQARHRHSIRTLYIAHTNGLRVRSGTHYPDPGGSEYTGLSTRVAGSRRLSESGALAVVRAVNGAVNDTGGTAPQLSESLFASPPLSVSVARIRNPVPPPRLRPRLGVGRPWSTPGRPSAARPFPPKFKWTESRLAQLRVENTQGDEDSDDGEDIDKADADAQTPPIEAAERGHEAVVKVLL